ncbi:MAG: ABC transporter permease [Coprobacillus sp.]|nr:ABC transporter permease [Coprobacillus sp.]
MTTYTKTIFRMFKQNKGRFALIISIIALSLLLCSGLGVTHSAMEKSYNSVMQEQLVSDFLIKSESEEGFGDDYETIVSSIEEDDPIACIDSYFNADYTVELIDDSVSGLSEMNARIYYGDLQNREVNSLELLEGRFPKSANECVLDTPNGFLIPYEIGDTITFTNLFSSAVDEINEAIGTSLVDPLDDVSLTVVGFVQCPLYSTGEREPMLTEDLADVSDLTEISEYIDAIIYIDSEYDVFSLASLNEELSAIKSLASSMGLSEEILSMIPEEISAPINEIAIRFNSDSCSLFSREHKELMNEKTPLIEGILSDINAQYLTLEDNVGYSYFTSFGNKMLIISILLPIFFILVCSLVISITTSRMVNDERGMIGCYTSLGIPRGKIIWKYFLFNLIVILSGAVIGIVVGIFLVPAIVYPSYCSVFHMGALMFSGNIWLGLLLSIALLVIVLLICYSVINANLKESPASLLLPKSPKAGQKIFLEKIPALWKRIKFSMKSCFRNIFRYKKNMILTIISVMGSAALIMVGFGLLDNSIALVDDPLYGSVAGPILIVSIFVLVLAGLLCLLILFNLVNMNISERERELCTLKVLGYHDQECLLYTSREVLILSAAGGIVGIPVGMLLVYIICVWLDFGRLGNMNWYSYVLTFVYVFVIAFIANLLLYPKIKKLDMNESLKSVE